MMLGKRWRTPSGGGVPRARGGTQPACGSKRRRPGVRVVVPLLWLVVAGTAHAGGHDLALLNLCPPAPAPGGASVCSWLQRGPGGVITGVVPDAGANERFRSLMSELGAVLAPQVVSPASSIGYAGFQFSADLATTSINADADYWDGVAGVNPANRLAGRPANFLTTVGASVRKGIWLPVPSMEIGAGVVHLLQSQILAYQGYAKLAIHEGFQDLPLPAVAGRVALSHMTGNADGRVDVLSFDLIGSKPFGVMGTLQIEPFAGWSHLRILAKSGRVDLSGGDMAGPHAGYFRFDDQDTIVRNRLFGGLKLRFAVVHLSAEYTHFLAGGSRDGGDPALGIVGAKDNAIAQNRITFSTGFDF